MGKSNLTFHEDVYWCYCFNIYYFFFFTCGCGLKWDWNSQACLAVLVLCLPGARLHEHWGMSWEKEMGWMGSWQRALAVRMGWSECTMGLVTWSCAPGFLEAYVSCVERTGGVTKIWREIREREREKSVEVSWDQNGSARFFAVIPSLAQIWFLDGSVRDWGTCRNGGKPSQGHCRSREE